MKQEEIKYKTIIDLGFTEEPVDDRTYFDQYGFRYVIIQKKLCKTLYLEWAKETRKCDIYRTCKKGQNIKAREPIQSLSQLLNIIEFFKDKK